MNNYEKIKALLELNTLKGVACRENDEWKVFTNITGNGSLEGTYTKDSIKECWVEGLSNSPYDEPDMKKYFTDEIIPIPHKPKVLEKGTKVTILDIANDDWIEDAKGIVGQSGLEIRDAFDNASGVSYHIYNKDKTDYWTVPAYCVVPTFTEEKVELSMDEIAKKFGVDVSNLKIKK